MVYSWKQEESRLYHQGGIYMEKQETKGIIKRVESDRELKAIWDKLSDSAKIAIIEIDSGKRVPDILNDAMFKGVFDPDSKPEWIARLISSVLGQKVTVIRSLEGTGKKPSIFSKGIILDVVVEFEDGTIADVEIQRKGIRMPPKRGAMYSGELVRRQYAANEGEDLSSVDYDRVHPVHMIIIMEESLDILKSNANCVHHFRQSSDTGLVSSEAFELLQYYHFICLDVFKSERPHMARALEKWLEFLSIRQIDDMMWFLSDNPEFAEIYQKSVDMLKDREALLTMFQSVFNHEDVAGSINLTNESAIKRMTKEIDQKNTRIREQEDQINTQETKIHAQESQLHAQETQIQTQESQIREQQIQIHTQGTQIQEQETQLHVQETQLWEKETQLREQETQLHAQQDLLLEKDKEIAELKKQLNK